MPEFNTILKAGYGNKKARNTLEKQNYVLDKGLSNKNNQVWVNAQDKKIIHNVKGTNPFSPKDIGTDIYMGLGLLKKTDRYKDSKKILNNAKQKYNGFDTTVTGHSLGSSIGMNIADKKSDKFVGLNGYYQPFKPTSSNNGKFQHYRTQIDPVSIFGSNKTNVKTITNEHNPTGLLPLDLLKSHSVSAAKKTKIVI
jgi:Lipase (class 3)